MYRENQPLSIDISRVYVKREFKDIKGVSCVYVNRGAQRRRGGKQGLCPERVHRGEPCKFQGSGFTREVQSFNVRNSILPAMRAPSWVLMPRVSSMVIAVLRLSLTSQPSSRIAGAACHARTPSRMPCPGPIAVVHTLWEGRAETASELQKQRTDRTKQQQPLSPSRVHSARRQLCVEAGGGNVERVLGGKAGAGVADSGRRTLKELCDGFVPTGFLEKAEAIGFQYPTQAQEEALPVLLSGTDCLLHAQTGSGKTLAYLLPILSKLIPRSSVQAIIVVPTRELGMQVARVARSLMGKSSKSDETEGEEQKGPLSVMTLLDGGSASRQKRWIKAAPPQLIVGTLRCLTRLIDSQHLKTSTVTTLVIDEVDTMMGAAKEGNQLQNLLTVHTRREQRQTIFASATVPQHNRFIRDCIQNKWAKVDLVHIHVSPKVMMPKYLQHRYVVCNKQDKLQALVSVLNKDNPRAAIIFVNESDKAKRFGEVPNTSTTAEFLSEMIRQGILGKDDRDLWEPLILEEDDHINQRTSTLSDFREGRRLLVATDLAARGLDLPEVSHVYNIDMPPNVTSYIHRAGRTGRRPIEEERGTVTNFVIQKELFVLQRIENESQSNFIPLHVQS